MSRESNTVDVGLRISMQECSGDLNVRFHLWARIREGGFLRRGIMGPPLG